MCNITDMPAWPVEHKRHLRDSFCSYCPMWLSEGLGQKTPEKYISLLNEWLIWCSIEGSLFSPWQCWAPLMDCRGWQWVTGPFRLCCGKGDHCILLSMKGGELPGLRLSPPALTSRPFRAGLPASRQHGAGAGWRRWEPGAPSLL